MRAVSYCITVMAWIVSLKMYLLKSHSPIPRNVTLFEKRIITDVVTQDEIIRVGPHSLWLVSLLRKLKRRHIYRENAVWRCGQRSRRCSYQSRNTKGPQKITRGKMRGMGQTLPHSPQKEANLVDIFLIFTFMYLFYLAVPGLSCSPQDLQSLIRHAGSLSCGVWILSCRIWDLCSLTKDQTWAPCIGSRDS